MHGFEVQVKATGYAFSGELEPMESSAYQLLLRGVLRHI